MFIRCAFFRGRVKAGMEEAFDRHVHEKLVPLWTRFPGALESPVRYESREVSKKLFEMFDGTVFHTVFSAEEFALANAS
jgi:hypothetical protein